MQLATQSAFTPVSLPHFGITKATTPAELNAEFARVAAGLGGYQPVCLEEIPTAANGCELYTGIDVGNAAFTWRVPNSWVIHPMESWRSFNSQILRRKWRRFGEGGAGIIWNEATSVLVPNHDSTRMLGRANRNQLFFGTGAEHALAELLTMQREAHLSAFDQPSLDKLLCGIQCTHSGTYCFDEPFSARRHPQRVNPVVNDLNLATDTQIDSIAWAMVNAAEMAYRAGYKLFDFKCAHGYFWHELLCAGAGRPETSNYGGDIKNRLKPILWALREIRSRCPEMILAVRLSVYDRPIGDTTQYDYWKYHLGVSQHDPHQWDLTESLIVIDELIQAGVTVINVTCGSPYYSAAIQRPTPKPCIFDPDPKENFLYHTVRQMYCVSLLRRHYASSGVAFVNSGMSTLQHLMPGVALNIARTEEKPLIGMGRMSLPYWDMPADLAAGRGVNKKSVCIGIGLCTNTVHAGKREHSDGAHWPSVCPIRLMLDEITDEGEGWFGEVQAAVRKQQAAKTPH